MGKKILINARHPEEKRVAIVKGEELTDFYVEVPSAGHLRGNIYKGVISALDRGLQAAFVDFGPEKHGFLPLREVMTENYRAKAKGKNPDIKDVLAKGQELMVEVEQDQRGTKGAKLTNRVSLPGRYLVMIPGKERLGISRKIEEPEARDRLREAFKGLRVPKGMGFILRTAGADCSTEELSADLKYLTKLWNKIMREEKKAKPPSLLYREESIAVRTVRDYLTSDVTEVMVDDDATLKDVKNFLKLTMPWRSINVTRYKGKEPLFDTYGLEEQIDRLGDRQVHLPSGGSIVIDRAEALTAIDVNSGRAKDKDIEGLALRTNLEAAAEIARQLRLRDIGGLIVIDFIDLRAAKNYQKVEERLREALDLDKAHYDTTRISRFGMLEMSRERMRTSYSEASSLSCPACSGSGRVMSPERVAVSALRKIHSLAHAEGAEKLVCRLPVMSANHMMNELRDRLSETEKELALKVELVADSSLPEGEFSVETEGAQTKPAVPAKHGGAAPSEHASAKKSRRRRKKKKGAQTPESHEGGEAAHAEHHEEHSEGYEEILTPAAEEAQAENSEAGHPETAAPKKRRPRRRRRSPKKKTAPAAATE